MRDASCIVVAGYINIITDVSTIDGYGLISVFLTGRFPVFDCDVMIMVLALPNLLSPAALIEHNKIAK
jgi:hypothetical protein